VEYKSPGDYVSLNDFYKVYGYACLYTSFEQVPITDLTISFVESHYPRKLLDHLGNERGYKVAETSPGIYTVSGDIFPIQAIDSRKLPLEENLWLKSLSDELDLSGFSKVSGEIARQGKEVQKEAYLEAIARANSAILQEAIRMGDALTIEKVFEEVGWIAKWEAKGKAEGEEQRALAIARNMVNLGLPFETVISATGLDPEKVKALYQQ
jgi:predicted transposase YdaD